MRIMNEMVAAAAVFTASLAVLAAEHSVVCSSDGAISGSEAVSLVSVDGGKELCVGAQDGDIVTISGEKLEIDGDFKICLSNNVKLVFENEMAVSGSLETISPKAGIVSWEAPMEGDGKNGFKIGSDTLAFEGLKLVDYKLYSSDFSTRGNGISGLAKASYFTSDGEAQTAQFQRLDDVFTKCVKIAVSQAEEGIVARKLYGRYIRGNFFGLDFDVLSGYTPYDNYFMTQLTMILKVDENLRSVRFSNDISVGGGICVSNGVYVVCEKIGGLLDENGLFNKNVTVNIGAFIFESPESSFTMGGNFSGNEGVVGIVNAGKNVTDEDEGEYAYVYKEVMNYSEGYVLLQEKASLADVVAAKAYGTGSTLYPNKEYKNVELDAQFFDNDGRRMSCEFHVPAGEYFKGMGIHVKQIGGDIYAKLQYAAFVKTKDTPEAQEPGDWHFATKGWSTGNGGNGLANASTYSVSNLTLIARKPAGSYRETEVSLQMTNTMTDSVFVLEGCPSSGICAKATTLEASPFPSSGIVKVGSRAYLSMAVKRVPSYEHGYIGANTKLDIYDGGYVDQLEDKQFACKGVATVNGSVLAFLPNRGETGANGMMLADWTDSTSYIGTIEYLNGGRTLYCSPRIGLNNTNPSVKVYGNEPCRAEHGFALVASYYTKFKFDIDDVTRSGATDFTVTGTIRPFSPAHENFSIIKTGAGTMELTGVNNYTNYPTQVKEGTLRLGASGVMNRDMDVSLEGGSFAAAADTVNTLGELAVSADAGIAVSPGATLAFADSSATSWADGVRVDIVKDKTSTVRFGESASALTAKQIAAIRVNGYPCRLDETGCIKEYAGTVIILR